MVCPPHLQPFRASVLFVGAGEFSSLSPVNSSLVPLRKGKFKNTVCLRQAVLPLQKREWTQPPSSDLQHSTSIPPGPGVARSVLFVSSSGGKAGSWRLQRVNGRRRQGQSNEAGIKCLDLCGCRSGSTAVPMATARSSANLLGGAGALAVRTLGGAESVNCPPSVVVGAVVAWFQRAGTWGPVEGVALPEGKALAPQILACPVSIRGPQVSHAEREKEIGYTGLRVLDL